MEEDTSHTDETAITIDLPDVDDTSKKKDCDKIEANAKQRLDDHVFTTTKLPYEKKTFTVCMAYMDEFKGPEPDDPIAMADPWSRKRFIRNTFMIVFLMLLITAVCAGLVRIPGNSVSDFFLHHFQVISISSGIALLVLIIMFSCIYTLRTPPWVYFMVPLLIAATSLFTAAVTVRYETNAIIIAIVATLVICVVAAGLSFTRFDFTRWYAVVGFVFLGVAVASVIFMVLGLVLGTNLVIMHLILCIVTTAALAVSLIIQFQMILGGKSIEIDDSQYLVAAYMVYSSIISLFLKLLTTTGLLNSMS